MLPVLLLKASHPLHPSPPPLQSTTPKPTSRNDSKADGDLLQHHIVSLAPTSGWDGAKAHAPYDAIHVGAAAASVPRCVQLSSGWGCFVSFTGQRNEKGDFLCSCPTDGPTRPAALTHSHSNGRPQKPTGSWWSSSRWAG